MHILAWSLIQLMALACTTVLVSREASSDDGPLVAHNNDCIDCDFRVVKVPSRRINPSYAVFPCKFTFPRFVGDLRGYPDVTRADSNPLAVLQLPDTAPRLNRTYSYLEASYPMQNEAGLSMGESTCDAIYAAKSVLHGGHAHFDIVALMRFAMEFCATARCAIEMMGELAERYGYYGADDPAESGASAFEESGEALTIADAIGEAWVFHVLPDSSLRSAIWAACQLSPGHIAVIQNVFTLVVDSNCLSSKNLRSEIARVDPTQSAAEILDFRVFQSTPPDDQGRTMRRTWRVYSLFADPKLDATRNRFDW